MDSTWLALFTISIMLIMSTHGLLSSHFKRGTVLNSADTTSVIVQSWLGSGLSGLPPLRWFTKLASTSDSLRRVFPFDNEPLWFHLEINNFRQLLSGLLLKLHSSWRHNVVSHVDWPLACDVMQNLFSDTPPTELFHVFVRHASRFGRICTAQYISR